MTHERIPAGTSAGRAFDVRAADGRALAARVYEGSHAPRANVIVHSATAVPQTYYGPFAQALVADGPRVVTYDYRGVGASRPATLDGFEATMTEWATLDARAILSAVCARLSECGRSSSVTASAGR